MELSWSTFVLEIVNFVVLVWILKRFFYAPVRRVIERRREAVEASIAQAEQKRAEAKDLEEQYQSRLTGWEHEEKQARDRLQQEVAAERERLFADLRASLEKEREKARVLEQRRLGELGRQAQERAVSQGAEFAARVLAGAAVPQVQDRLFDMLIAELPRFWAANRGALAGGAGGGRPAVKVVSAFPLSEAQRQSLERTLGDLSGGGVFREYQQDPALIAGVRLNVGAMILRANLRDELQFFSEAANVPNR